jgi:hypothetical protein
MIVIKKKHYGQGKEIREKERFDTYKRFVTDR